MPIDRKLDSPPEINQPVIATEWDPFIPLYDQSDYLDMESLESEQKDMVIRLGQLEDRVAKNPIIVKKEHLIVWGKLNHRFKEINGLILTLNNQLDNSLPEGQGLTHHRLISIHQVKTALLFMLDETFQRQLSFIEVLDISEDAKSEIKAMMNFRRQTQTFNLDLKIAGVCLRDLWRAKEEKMPPPNKVLQFFIDASIARANCALDPIIANNPTDLVKKYPNSTKNWVEVTVAQIWSLNQQDLSLSKELMIPDPKINSEIISWLKKLSSHLNIYRQQLDQGLSHPDSTDFPALKEVLNRYLNQPFLTRIIAINTLIQARVDRVPMLYRLAKELEKQTGDLLYQTLAQGVREYAENIPQVIQLQTFEDVETILDENGQSDINQSPTFEELAKKATPIFNFTSTKKFELDPQTINWFKLIPPQSLSVNFDKNRPKSFWVSLKYLNQDGEDLRIDLHFDTQKNNFSWNILEWIDENSDIKNFFNILKVNASIILEKIRIEAEKTYHQKKLPKAQPQVTPKFTKEPYQKTPKEVSEKKPKLLPTPLNLIIREKTIEESRVVYQLELPSLDELSSLTKKLSTVDQQIVINGLPNINLQGNQNFKMLRTLGADGKPQYSLRINCTVRGGIRVLLQEASSTNGERKFKVQDKGIGYRKDIYREKGI